MSADPRLILADAMAEHDYAPAYEAYICAALEQTSDVSEAVRIADEAFKRQPKIEAEPQEDDASALFARDAMESKDASGHEHDPKTGKFGKGSGGTSASKDDHVNAIKKHIGDSAQDADPKKTKSFDMSKYKDVADSISKMVKDHAETKSFKSLTITDIADKFPNLKIEQIHQILGKMHHDGLIRLGPFTQGLMTHERPEHLLPLDREAKYFVRPR